jgi:hypothetical protein
MKCTKCGYELEATGAGRALSNDPIKWGYECTNSQCPNFHKVGRIIGVKFQLDRKTDNQ